MKLNNIPGGLSAKKAIEKYPPEQLEKGIKVEMEHSKNRLIAAEIAADHLEENPRYYDYLEDMEEKMEKKAFWSGFEHEIQKLLSGVY